MLRCLRKLFVSAKYNNTQPIPFAGDLIHLNTNQRIRAHPLDLLPDRSEPINKIAIKRKIDRDNVRLIVASTRESANVCALQRPPAFHLTHLMDKHLTLQYLKRQQTFHPSSPLVAGVSARSQVEAVESYASVEWKLTPFNRHLPPKTPVYFTFGTFLEPE